MKFLLIICLLIILSSYAFAEEKKNTETSKPKQKIKLIFSIDQILSNGILVNDDKAALKNIIDAVKPLKEYYSVYLLLDPMIKDKEKLFNALDVMNENGQNFVLDVMTSDVQALSGHIPYLIDPYDKYHGMTVSVNELKAIKRRYPRNFAGVRFMEQFGADFSTRCAKNTELTEQWVEDYRKFPIPEDDYLQGKNIETYLKFCKENRIFAEWTDFHWYAFSEWDEHQIKNEEILAEAIKKYPDTVIICYSNNEPLELSVPKVDYFDKAFKTVAEKGNILGTGLSNQSWIRTNQSETTAEELILWCKSAIKKECVLIQFESAFYFFNLPIGKLDSSVTDYRTEEEYSKGKAGKATKNFKEIEKWLMDYGKNNFN